MNSAKNKVQLTGSLGVDPEIRTLENGKRLAKAAIVTSETFKNPKGESITENQWHNLVAWDKVADIMQKSCKRGCELAIEGKLINRHYIDKEGIKRYVTEIEVSELLLLE